jgi:hypothetical protein
MIFVENNFQGILINNLKWIERFNQSDMVTLLEEPIINSAASVDLLLDCIQTFSNYFQKTVLLRATLTDNNKFSTSARQHLDEEYGHDVLIASLRQHRPPCWDPILEATSAWFSWKMLTLDNIEKTLLVHLVLESSAVVFFKTANETLKKYDYAKYFSIHDENDPHHETMGTDLLKNLRAEEYQSLLLVQNQGWEILIAACNRMAHIVKTESGTQTVTTNEELAFSN